MTNKTINPITGKVDVHTYKMQHKAHDLAMKNLVKTREINDSGSYREETALALIQPLSITPYQSKKTTLHTRDAMLPVLMGDGTAESSAFRATA
jgi:hypothetical protein